LTPKKPATAFKLSIVRTKIFRGFVGFLAPLMASVIAAPAGAQSVLGNDILQNFQNHPEVQSTGECYNYPVPEWEKFRGCQIAFEGEIALFNEERLRQIEERRQTEQDRLWAWFDESPVADCNAVPEQEIAKFINCRPLEITDSGNLRGVLLQQLETQLADLIERRNGLAARLEELENRAGRIESASASSAAASASADLPILQDVSAQLQAKETYSALMTALARHSARAGGELPAGSIEFAQLLPQSDIWSDASGGDAIGSSGDSAQTIIVVRTASDSGGRQFIIHSKFGAGFANTDRINAR
jgi:hypothetical protein